MPDFKAYVSCEAPPTLLDTNRPPHRAHPKVKPTDPASPSTMKLAILGSRGFPSTYGGYETLVRHLAPYLAQAGHEVTVYCRARKAGQRVWHEEGVRCIATPGYDSKSLSTLTFGMTATLDAAFRSFDSVLVLNIANGFWFPVLRAARTPFA